MALVLADRVKETTTTTGTATYTLSGAETGFESFGAIGDGNKTYYCCSDGTDFEVGIGTYTASGTTLARTVILQSSNSDSAVSWSSGSKNIFCTQPAEKAVFLDASGHIIASDGRNLTNVDAATLDGIDSGSFLRSDATDTKTSGNLHFSDNVKATFGDTSSPDLEIFHDGNSTLIDDRGTGSLFIRSSQVNIQNDPSDTSRENMATFAENGAVTLMHDGAVKFFTTSTGATVTGTLVADKLQSDDVQINGTSNDFPSETGNAHIIATNNGGSFPFNESGSILYRPRQNDTDGRGNHYFYTGATPTLRQNIKANGDIAFYASDGTSQNLFWDASTSRLGINNTSPSTAVDITGDLTLTSTDDSANSTPELKLVRHSASPADFDYIGGLSFFADNSADQNIEFGTLEARIRDVTDGTEDFAGFELFGIKNGTARQRFMILGQEIFHLMNQQSIRFDDITSTHDLIFSPPSSLSTSQTITLPDATGTVLLDTGDQSITGDLTLTSTDAGASENPTLDLYRNSSSPADNDVLGHIHFSGENDADQKVAYGEIEMRALDVSDGTEDGRLVINSILNGTTVTHYATGFGFNQFFKDVLFAQNINMQFEGATNDGVRTTVTVADPSSNRTITLPDASGTVALNESGILNLTNSGSQSELRLYCESSNAHYAALKAPAHSAFSGNVDITLPATAGTLALTSSNITGNAATATTATNSDTVDNKHISVVTSLPSSPDPNTIYFVTG